MPGTFTPNIHLYKPLTNEVGWDALVNTNFDILDSQIAGIEAELPLSTLGDTLYENATPAPARLPGNITATKMYLSQTGTGTISAAPVWSQINYADIAGTVPTPPSGSVLWNAIGNPSANLSLSMAGRTTTFNQTSAVQWLWANTTAATNVVAQSSPILALNGQNWVSGVNTTDQWTMQSVQSIQSPGGMSQLIFTHAAGATTLAQVTFPDNGGTISGTLYPSIGIGNVSQGFIGTLPGIGTGLAFLSGSSPISFVDNFAPNNPGLYFWYSGGGSGFISVITGTNAGLPMFFNNSGYTLATASSGFSFGGSSVANTSGAFLGFAIGDQNLYSSNIQSWAPTSGTGTYVGLSLQSTINQTGTSSGSYTGLLVNITETALRGSANKLLDLQSGVSGGVSVFNVDRAGNLTQLNQTVATSGTTNASPTRVFSAQYWTGAASATDTWTIGSSLAAGTNGNSTLNITQSGSTGIAYFRAPNFIPRGAVQAGDQTGGLFSFSTPGTNLCLNGNASSTYSICGAHAGTLTWGTTTTVASSTLGNTSGQGGAAFNWGNGGLFGWNSGAVPNQTIIDITISRLGAGMLALGALNNVCQDLGGGLMCTNIATTNLLGSTTVAQLATPAAPTVTKGTGSGATTWGYKVVAKDSLGNVTAVSTEGTVGAQNASLTGSPAAYNKILVTRVPGAWTYDIYRTTVGTSPSTTGKIATISANASDSSLAIMDDGQATLTAAANASGGNTAYTGTFVGFAGTPYLVAGRRITIAGFTNGANNGTFTCVSESTTTLVVNNPSGVAETHAGTSIVAGDGITAPTVNTTGVLATSGGFSLTNPTIATNLTTNATPVLTFSAQYWTGGASAADTWTFQSSLAAGTNGNSILTIAHGGSSGASYVIMPHLKVGAQSFFGVGTDLILDNNQGLAMVNAANNGFASQIYCDTSNILQITSISGIKIGDLTTTNVHVPNPQFIGFGTTAGANQWQLLGDNSTGTLATNNGFGIFGPNGTSVDFRTGTGHQVDFMGFITLGAVVGSADTGISRLAAGSLAIGNGTAADFTGSLKLTNLNVQGGQIVNRVSKSANYTTTATDFVITFTATATVTLDSAAAVSGTMYRIKLSTAAAGGSTLTISPNNSKTIEGSATDIISTLGGSVDVVYNGSTNWEVF